MHVLNFGFKRKNNAENMFLNGKLNCAVITKYCSFQHKYLSRYIYHDSSRCSRCVGCDAHTLPSPSSAWRAFVLQLPPK